MELILNIILLIIFSHVFLFLFIPLTVLQNSYHNRTKYRTVSVSPISKSYMYFILSSSASISHFILFISIPITSSQQKLNIIQTNTASYSSIIFTVTPSCDSVHIYIDPCISTQNAYTYTLYHYNLTVWRIPSLLDPDPGKLSRCPMSNSRHCSRDCHVAGPFHAVRLR